MNTNLKTLLYASYLNLILAVFNIIIFMIHSRNLSLLIAVLNVCVAIIAYNTYKIIEGDKK